LEYIVQNVKAIKSIIVDHRFKTRYYSCKKCGLNFSDYTGTIFHKTKVPISVIFYILFNLPFKGVSMTSKELPYSRKTITRIANLTHHKKRIKTKR
jgi:transposase-like protein